jgi:hypothetical protein
MCAAANEEGAFGARLTLEQPQLRVRQTPNTVSGYGEAEARRQR